MTDQIPAAMPETPEPLLDGGTHSAKDLLTRYGIPAGLAALIFVAFISTTGYLRSGKERARSEAIMTLTNVKSIADLEPLAAGTSSTGVAPLALLHLAKAYYDQGDYGKAESTYASFTTRFPKHRFAASAALGRIHAIEAVGRTQEALEAFQAFPKDQPGHFQIPQALLGQARCLESLGRGPEARQIYEDMIVGNAKDDWGLVAEDLLNTMEARAALPAAAPSQPQMPLMLQENAGLTPVVIPNAAPETTPETPETPADSASPQP